MTAITLTLLIAAIITIAVLTLGEVLAESNTRSRKYARNWRVDR